MSTASSRGDQQGDAEASESGAEGTFLLGEWERPFRIDMTEPAPFIEWFADEVRAHGLWLLVGFERGPDRQRDEPIDFDASAAVWVHVPVGEPVPVVGSPIGVLHHKSDFGLMGRVVGLDTLDPERTYCAIATYASVQAPGDSWTEAFGIGRHRFSGRLTGERAAQCSKFLLVCDIEEPDLAEQVVSWMEDADATRFILMSESGVTWRELQQIPTDSIRPSVTAGAMDDVESLDVVASRVVMIDIDGTLLCRPCSHYDIVEMHNVHLLGDQDRDFERVPEAVATWVEELNATDDVDVVIVTAGPTRNPFPKMRFLRQTTTAERLDVIEVLIANGVQVTLLDDRGMHLSWRRWADRTDGVDLIPINQYFGITSDVMQHVNELVRS